MTKIPQEHKKNTKKHDFEFQKTFIFIFLCSHASIVLFTWPTLEQVLVPLSVELIIVYKFSIQLIDRFKSVLEF